MIDEIKNDILITAIPILIIPIFMLINNYLTPNIS